MDIVFLIQTMYFNNKSILILDVQNMIKLINITKFKIQHYNSFGGVVKNKTYNDST